MAFAKDSLITFSTKVFIVLIGMITNIILVRILGPSGKGIYSLVILVPALLFAMGNFGIGIANIFFIGKKAHPLSNVISNSLILGFGLGTILAMIFVLLHGHFDFSFLRGVNPHILVIGLIGLPFLFIINYFSTILMGENRFVEYNLVSVLNWISLLGLLILFLIIFTQGILGAVISWALAVFGASICSIYFVLKSQRIKLSLSLGLLKDSIKFGVQGYFGNLAQMLNYRLDMFFVNFFMGVTYVGYYSIAVLIAELLWLFPSAVGTVLFPKVSSMTTEEANEWTPKVCRNTFFITLISSLVLVFLGRWIIVVLFGNSFLPALKALWILLPGIVALSIPKILGNELTGRGRPIINLYIAITSLGINLPLNIILIPKWGIEGAAFASTVAYFVTTILTLSIFLKISKNRVIDTIVIKPRDLNSYYSIFQGIKI